MLKLHLSTRKRLVIMAYAMAGLLSHGAAFAANPEPVVVQVSFVDPITITEIDALQFGLLDQNLAVSETVVIAPGGGVTDAASRVLGGRRSRRWRSTSKAAACMKRLAISDQGL